MFLYGLIPQMAERKVAGQVGYEISNDGSFVDLTFQDRDLGLMQWTEDGICMVSFTVDPFPIDILADILAVRNLADLHRKLNHSA